uniref:Sugar phosphate transporter domain-containing protein n=1 Tax=Cryptomonas curvata TaxID=233186 RepID=A0A7S0MAL8_9CRYP
MDSEVLLAVGVSCGVGVGISYSGWWCRSKLSATSYTVVGFLNKVVVVAINAAMWDNHASVMGIAALHVCIMGGLLYEQAPPRVAAAARVDRHGDPEAGTGGDSEMAPLNLKDPGQTA